MIFVDTSFWVAIRNRRDPHHERAVRLLEAQGTRPLVTTNTVRGESWTLMRSRADHRLAVAFLDALERSPRTQVVRVSEDQENESLLWLRRHDERPYSFVDATSFVVMRSLRIEEVLSFDRDFVAAGFRVLGLEEA